jgi:predicted amidohydrolase
MLRHATNDLRPIIIVQSVFVMLAFACHRPTAAAYTAAAVQLSPLGSYSDSARSNLAKNLAQFASLAKSATGIDIIVFPEAVLWVFGLSSRAGMLQYAEIINTTIPMVPCDDAQQPLQIRSLSCIAKENAVILVANMVSIVPCHGEPDCPSDGFFLFNTDVAFHETGVIAAVYHKMHIFGTASILNQPAASDPVSFRTSFGVEFGMVRVFLLIICAFSMSASSYRF